MPGHRDLGLALFDHVDCLGILVPQNIDVGAWIGLFESPRQHFDRWQFGAVPSNDERTGWAGAGILYCNSNTGQQQTYGKRCSDVHEVSFSVISPIEVLCPAMKMKEKEPVNHEESDKRRS